MKRPPIRSRTALLIPLCLYFFQGTALASGDSTKIAFPPEVAKPSIPAGQYKNFETLSIPGDHADPSDPVVVNDYALSDSVLDQRNHAHALLEKVLSGQRFLESLDALSEIELPIGVVKAGGAVDYSILIDRIEFTKLGATMDVYVSLALPQTGSRLAFHGKVPLSAQGGIAGNAKVYLLGDHPVKLSSTSMITLKGSERSYVEFDCTGFLGVNLDAELEFSNDLIVPEDEAGEAKHDRVKVAFTTYTQSLHDIMLSVSMPPFQVKG